MALPASWPPRQSSGIRSFRFYVMSTATAAYADNAYMFGDVALQRNVTPLPYVPPGGERTTVNIPPTPWGGGRDPHDNQPIGSPAAQFYPDNILIFNSGIGDILISFDGVNPHGFVKAGTERVYRHRYESGISVQGTGVFYIEAW